MSSDSFLSNPDLEQELGALYAESFGSAPPSLEPKPASHSASGSAKLVPASSRPAPAYVAPTFATPPPSRPRPPRRRTAFDDAFEGKHGGKFDEAFSDSGMIPQHMDTDPDAERQDDGRGRGRVAKRTEVKVAPRRGVKRALESAPDTRDEDRRVEVEGMIQRIDAPSDYAQRLIQDEWPVEARFSVGDYRFKGKMRVMDPRLFSYSITGAYECDERTRRLDGPDSAWKLGRVDHKPVKLSDSNAHWLPQYVIGRHTFVNEPKTKSAAAHESLANYLLESRGQEPDLVAWLVSARNTNNPWAQELINSKGMVDYLTALDCPALLDFFPLHVLRDLSFEERRRLSYSLGASLYDSMYPTPDYRTGSQSSPAPESPKEDKQHRDGEYKSKAEAKTESPIQLPIVLPRVNLYDLVKLYNDMEIPTKLLSDLTFKQFMCALFFHLMDTNQRSSGSTASYLADDADIIQFTGTHYKDWTLNVQACTKLYQELFKVPDHPNFGSDPPPEHLPIMLSPFLVDHAEFVIQLAKERRVIVKKLPADKKTKTPPRRVIAAWHMWESAETAVLELRNFYLRASRLYPVAKDLINDGSHVSPDASDEDKAKAETLRQEYAKLGPKQKEIHESIRRFPITLVKGAAGTGKSYASLRFLTADREEKLPFDPEAAAMGEDPKPKWIKRTTGIVLTPTNRIANATRKRYDLDSETFHYFLEWGMWNDLGDRLRDARVLGVEETTQIGEHPLCTLTRIIRSMPNLQRIIIIGDDEQLLSVDPGRVLHDLSLAPWINTVVLDQVYRVDELSKMLIYCCRCVANGDFFSLPESDPAFEVKEFDPKTSYKEIYDRFKDADPGSFQMLSYRVATAREANLAWLTESGRCAATDKTYPSFLSVGDKIICAEKHERHGNKFDKGQGLAVNRIYDAWADHPQQVDVPDTRAPTHMHPQTNKPATCRMIETYDPESRDVYSFPHAADVRAKFPPGDCVTLHSFEGDQADHIAYFLERNASRRHLYTAISRARKGCIVYARNSGQAWADIASAVQNVEEPRLTALGCVIRSL